MDMKEPLIPAGRTVNDVFFLHICADSGQTGNLKNQHMLPGHGSMMRKTTSLILKVLTVVSNYNSI